MRLVPNLVLIWQHEGQARCAAISSSAYCFAGLQARGTGSIRASRGFVSHHDSGAVKIKQEIILINVLNCGVVTHYPVAQVRTDWGGGINCCQEFIALF